MPSIHTGRPGVDVMSSAAAKDDACALAGKWATGGDTPDRGMCRKPGVACPPDDGKDGVEWLEPKCGVLPMGGVLKCGVDAPCDDDGPCVPWLDPCEPPPLLPPPWPPPPWEPRPQAEETVTTR